MDDQPNQEILDATYRALCEHGYADLTMQDIAAQSGKSKATIHYHYDSKHDLFTAFLEYLYEGYTDRLGSVTGETPRERLLALIDASLSEGDEEDAPGIDFRTAMLEIKAQSPYDDAFRDRLADFDRFLSERFRDVVAEGVETGEFRDEIDPETAAEFLTTTVKGAHTRRVAVDHSLDRIHETLVRYVETHLAVDSTGAETDAAAGTATEVSH